MRMLDRQEWFVRAVAGLFQIPIAKLQIAAERMTYGATMAQFETMDDGPAAILWRLRELENQSIVGAFGDVKDHNVALDYPIMSKRDEGKQADVTEIQIAGNPYISVNQARRDAGLEPLEGKIYDEILWPTPSGPIPLSVLMRQYAADPEADPQDSGDQNPGKRFMSGRRLARSFGKALPPSGSSEARTPARGWWRRAVPAEARSLVDAVAR